MSNPLKLSCILAAFTALAAPAVLAQDLAGAPQGYEAGPEAAPPPVRRASHHRGEACYAQVRYPSVPAPPPSGPEYVWTQAPAPPGAPGPVWCLTVTRFAGAPVPVMPERTGWIRVLCADDATPARITRLQRRLHARGLYRGEISGRYDAATAEGVAAFQRERHIGHRGYLSYETMAALDATSPCCEAAPSPAVPCCTPAYTPPPCCAV